MMHSSHTETHPPAPRDNQQSRGMHDSSLRRLQRSVIVTLFYAFCAGVLVFTLLVPVLAEEPSAPAEIPSLPAAETPPPTPAPVDPVTIDPFIELRGSVWRTKAGIVFLKTPIGLLTLTSKTTLKDLKASQEPCPSSNPASSLSAPPSAWSCSTRRSESLV